MTIPAAIRTKNPGAQWPNDLAKKFGMTGSEHLNDGNNSGRGNEIAIFPTAVQGAASNMALLDRSYIGLTISNGQNRWSGQHRAGLPGWDGSLIINKTMTADAKFMVAFMKSIADAEAPHGSQVLTDAQWKEAYDLFRSTIYGAKPVEAPAPEPAPVPTPAPQPVNVLAALFKFILGLFQKGN